MVSLRLFDAQGRRVATIAEPVARPTGAGRIGVSVGDLAPGCYIYRVEAEGCTASHAAPALAIQWRMWQVTH